MALQKTAGLARLFHKRGTSMMMELMISSSELTILKTVGSNTLEKHTSSLDATPPFQAPSNFPLSMALMGLY